MPRKPAYLGPERASAFQDPSVVAAYRYRAPYPPATFDLLRDLIVDEPRQVLDVGCGLGDVARGLVDIADHIDAVDISAGMVAAGRRLPNGDRPNLRWLVGPAETVELDPPYTLITAGQSLHWMDWDVVLPRFAAAITPHGSLALVNSWFLELPWSDELQPIIKRYSTNQDYVPVDLIAELEQRGLFEQRGERQTAPVPFAQSVDDYVESFHGMSSFSRDRMPAGAATAFDSEVRDVLAAHGVDQVELQVVGGVLWGRPLIPNP